LLRGALGEDEAPFGQVWHNLICACRKIAAGISDCGGTPKIGLAEDRDFARGSGTGIYRIQRCSASGQNVK
jgi:hypothetical protein